MLQEVVRFFEQPMASSGQNVKFNVEHISEVDEFTAEVNWHLGNIVYHCVTYILSILFQ